MIYLPRCWVSLVAQTVTNLPAMQETWVLIPGVGKCPRGGQYSCLENSMDRRAWRATVHGITKSRTRLKWLSTHAPCGQIFLIDHLGCNCVRVRIMTDLFLTISSVHNGIILVHILHNCRISKWMMIEGSCLVVTMNT